jgi:CDP-glucose 4,6-dehydratase
MTGTPFRDIYRGKRAFLTGHTGFKGSWLGLWLHQLGAEVTGYSLPPPTEPSHFELAGIRGLVRHVEADIRDAARLRDAVAEAKPHVVFHLAAQPLVRESYRLPLDTLDTNVTGTAHVLEAVRAYAGPRKPVAVIIITSDKCYENREWVYGYREDDPMGGCDPYSMSKGAAELVVSSWRKSFFPPERIAEHGVRLASARAGNAIGGGDWGKDRILTDCIAALRAGEPVGVRNPLATRPWQHVLEPLSGYLFLGARLLDPVPGAAARFAEAWNFGPHAESVWPVSRLVDEVIHRWGSGGWKDLSGGNAPHEATLLALSCDKAFHRLGWRPTWGVAMAVERTVSWFKAMTTGEDMRDVTLRQIIRYEADAAAAHAAWVGESDHERR